MSDTNPEDGGLRRTADRAARVERLRELIRKGEESGDPQPFDFEKFLESKFPNA